MTVNGSRYDLRPGTTLHGLLDHLKIDPRLVVVMHGDEIYRAGKIPDAALKESDVLEIVTMSQGG
ncbi:MAG TPA: sulfur carrier protein ThiS [Gemmatimonadaceae bacterium]|jgi:thiamine biosynthesis protein ThiS